MWVSCVASPGFNTPHKEECDCVMCDYSSKHQHKTSGSSNQYMYALNKTRDWLVLVSLYASHDMTIVVVCVLYW